MAKIRKYVTRGLIPLVLFTVISLAGYSFWLQYERNCVRYEVKSILMESMDRSDLNLLVFTPSEAAKELIWEDDSEFEFNGEMYDVVETEFLNGKIYYWCWADQKESELNQKLDHLTAFILGNSPEEEDKKQQLTKLGRSLFVEALKEHRWVLLPQNKGKIPVGAPERFISSTSPPPIPPPELC